MRIKNDILKGSFPNSSGGLWHFYIGAPSPTVSPKGGGGSRRKSFSLSRTICIQFVLSSTILWPQKKRNVLAVLFTFIIYCHAKAFVRVIYFKSLVRFCRFCAG